MIIICSQFKLCDQKPKSSGVGCNVEIDDAVV